MMLSSFFVQYSKYCWSAAAEVPSDAVAWFELLFGGPRYTYDRSVFNIRRVNSIRGAGGHIEDSGAE